MWGGVAAAGSLWLSAQFPAPLKDKNGAVRVVGQKSDWPDWRAKALFAIELWTLKVMASGR